MVKQKRLLYVFLVATGVLWTTALFVRPDDAAAAARCVQLYRQQGGETLVNRCNTCLVVNVMRLRPGAAMGQFPTNRAFTLPGGARQPLPFLGPGETRVTGVSPCPAPPGSAVAAPHPPSSQTLGGKADGKRCLILGQKQGVGMVVVNTCGQCRVATIERVYPTGKTGLARYGIKGHEATPLSALGALRARIAQDAPCRP